MSTAVLVADAPCGRSNISTRERWLTGALGAALGAVGWRYRASGGKALMVAGGALVARAATGFCPGYAVARRGLPAGWNPPAGLAKDDTKRALSGGRGIHMRATVSVARPVHDVYAFWRNFENLPRFMAHLESVRILDDRLSRWAVRAPTGPNEWTAEIVHEEPDRLIGWRSIGGSEIVNAGSVTFRPANGDGTRVEVSMQYRPPGGKAGAAVAALLGRNPSQMLCEDLARLKKLLEGRG